MINPNRRAAFLRFVKVYVDMPSENLDKLFDVKSNVYFIQGSLGGPVKIGKSKNINSRIKELQCGNPHKLSCVSYIPHSGYAVESLLHGYFSPYQTYGEWYAENEDLKVLMGWLNANQVAKVHYFCDECGGIILDKEGYVTIQGYTEWKSYHLVCNDKFNSGRYWFRVEYIRDYEQVEDLLYKLPGGEKWSGLVDLFYLASSRKEPCRGQV